MKAGRPTCHIKAKWITIDRAGVSLFFLLNAKGDLVKVNGKIVPHHGATTVAVALNPVQEQPHEQPQEQSHEQSQDLFIPDDVQPVFDDWLPDFDFPYDADGFMSHY
jgi:hypothetical protein